MGDSNQISIQEAEENWSAREDEIEALEAIYGDAFEVMTRGSAASPTSEVRIRVSEIPMVSLHLRLSEGYPSRELPDVEIRAPGLGQAARNELCEALRPGRGGEGGYTTDSSPGLGNVVVFDWAETLRDLLSRQDSHPSAAGTDGEKGNAVADRPEAFQEQFDGVSRDCVGNFDDERSGWEGSVRATAAGSSSGAGISGGGGVFAEAVKDVEEEKKEEGFVEIFHGEPFTDRKSTFQAHLARVSSEKQVSWARHRLLENGKIARATHNIAAWRVWDEARGVQLHDNDDDGETAAGSRLAHMLAITGAQNVLVVVSRWFGGIHLGPDRFKHINNAARELLVQCGATATNGGTRESKAGPTTGGKHRGRRKRGSGNNGGT